MECRAQCLRLSTAGEARCNQRLHNAQMSGCRLGSGRRGGEIYLQGDVAEWRALGVEKLPGDGVEGGGIVYTSFKGLNFVLVISVEERHGDVRSWTAFQSCLESSLDSDMIPLAVPFRRKSASLTLLMNASCRTLPSASRFMRCSAGQSVKCKVNRHGNVPPSSSEALLSSAPAPGACDEAAPEKRS